MLDASGHAPAYVWAREKKTEADIAKVLTFDEARPLAARDANYVWPEDDVGQMYKLQEQRLLPVPVSTTQDTVKKPGGILAISANGAAAGSGILWATTGDYDASWVSVPGVLRAFDAADIAKEIWNSRQDAERDDLGLLAKFNTPIVANGKVYVATFSKQIAVYGLLSEQ